MSDVTTSPATTPRTAYDLAVAAVVAWADRQHAREDAAAHRDGLTVARRGLTGRTYRDPRFSGRNTHHRNTTH